MFLAKGGASANDIARAEIFISWHLEQHGFENAIVDLSLWTKDMLFGKGAVDLADIALKSIGQIDVINRTFHDDRRLSDHGCAKIIDDIIKEGGFILPYWLVSY